VPGQQGISEVRLLHAASRVDASFDEVNLVSAAGLVPLMRLAVTAGLWRLVRDRLRVGGTASARTLLHLRQLRQQLRPWRRHPAASRLMAGIASLMGDAA